MNRHGKFWLGLVLTAGLLVSGQAAAEMYKWVDDEGNVSYSQVPPPDRETQKIAPPPPAPVSPGKANEAEQESGPDSTWLAQQKAIAKQNCEAARNNLEVYQKSDRVRVDGKLVTVTDEMRQAKLKESEANIEKFCE